MPSQECGSLRKPSRRRHLREVLWSEGGAWPPVLREVPRIGGSEEAGEAGHRCLVRLLLLLRERAPEAEQPSLFDLHREGERERESLRKVAKTVPGAGQGAPPHMRRTAKKILRRMRYRVWTLADRSDGGWHVAGRSATARGARIIEGLAGTECMTMILPYGRTPPGVR